MEIVESIKKFFSNDKSAQLNQVEKTIIKSENLRSPSAYTGGVLFTQAFNGEKNLGEIGPIKRYTLDYNALRARAWQSFIESEITQTVINKYLTWVVGSGLLLKAEPLTEILSQGGIDVNSEAFSELTEVHWKLWSDSTCCDMGDYMTLGQIAWEAKKNAIVGGDVLVILRYIDGEPKVQLFDGANVATPVNLGSETYFVKDAEGNTTLNGVKYDDRGRILGFNVRIPGSINEYEYIPAYAPESNIKLAFMVYGVKYRIENKRGMPLIAVIMETLKKLERYKEATVGSAEERQKIPYFFEHQIFATGTNPLLDQMAKAVNYGNDVSDLPQTDDDLRQLADNVAATTNKMAFNMPKGTTAKALESRNELHFKDFYGVNIELICAALGIPPEVAMSKYDSNFSASRAALKDWEHTIMVSRADFTSQFYKNIYAFWFHINVLDNTLLAPGYILSYMNRRMKLVRAYLSCRFTGPGVPHIDPLKEVNAERLKLGDTASGIPLTSVEQAVEQLHSGDSDSNIKQYAEEIKMWNSLKPAEAAPVIPAEST